MASSRHSWFDDRINIPFSSNVVISSIDLRLDVSCVEVFFVDIGLHELVSLQNIRALPNEFRHQPAIAIPCRLSFVLPLYDKELSIWKVDDPIHEEFYRLITNLVTCTVTDFEEKLFYNVSIDHPSRWKHRELFY